MNFITAQLRESAPYLKDAGLRDTAKLVVAAAEEIELLYSLLQHAVPVWNLEKRGANENDALSTRPQPRADVALGQSSS